MRNRLIFAVLSICLTVFISIDVLLYRQELQNHPRMPMSVSHGQTVARRTKGRRNKKIIPKLNIKAEIQLALDAAVERLQMELELGVSLDQQEEINTSFTPSPLRGTAAPRHRFLVLRNQLEKMVVRVGDFVPSQLARQILVVSTWRSGSTFLGDLINHYPGVFYSFEPLMYNERVPNATIQPLPLLKILFQCDYHRLKDLVTYIKSIRDNSVPIIRYNTRLTNVCKNLLPKKAACYEPELLRKICAIHPIRMIKEGLPEFFPQYLKHAMYDMPTEANKVVRLRVRDIEPLLQDREIPNLQVITFFRDPRAIINSRASLLWCKTKQECAHIGTVCNDIQDDISAALSLNKKYPNKVMTLRYEDLIREPYSAVGKLLRFLNLPPFKQIHTFIETHTKVTPNISDNSTLDPYGTYRDSKRVAFAWMKNMSAKHVMIVQKACRMPMAMLGYNPVPFPDDWEKAYYIQ